MMRPCRVWLAVGMLAGSFSGCGGREGETKAPPTQEELDRFLVENPEYATPDVASETASAPLELGP